MKKIIGGKIYNTETAVYIGYYDNGYSGNDFHYCSESLYKTKKGTYFLAGKGGAMSRYSNSSGDMTSGSSDLNILTALEAKEWAESHLDPDEYLSEFEADEG